MARAKAAWTPLYDRRYSRVKNFKKSEDFMTIRQKFTGGTELYEDPGFSDYLEDGKVWFRARDVCNDPLFINDSPSRFDVIQGELDNCWLIAGMAALTTNKELIMHVIPHDQDFDDYYCGAFHFRIWQLGVWNDVVVDDRIPVYSQGATKLCYAHSASGKVFWGALLEKAYAKFIAKRTGKYEDLNQGVVITSLQDLSGGIVQKIFLEKIPEHKTIKEVLTEPYYRRNLMCASTHAKAHDKGLIPHHSYAITKVTELNHKDYNDLTLVRVMNTWGFEEWTGKWSDNDENEWRQIDRSIREKLEVEAREDGEFWMQVEDFCERFSDLWIAHLEPTGFLEMNDIHRENNLEATNISPTWFTLEIRGEWVDFLTAVGSELSVRHLNPQYVFNFGNPHPDASPTCPSVIDLIYRSKVGMELHSITYFVYQYDGTELPLTGELEVIQPLNNDYGFSYGSYNEMVYLRPGNFAVIPCTQGPNILGQYLLRVFTVCPLTLTARALTYDQPNKNLAKAMPLEEQSAIESNAIPTRMFIDTAQGKSEIDWIGLKNILEEAFNPSGSFFKMVLTFLKYIQDYFEINLVRSFYEKEMSKFIFTKDECRSMIAMYDEDHSGKLNISEFCDLWKKICFWIKVYEQYTDEGEGYLKIAQLREALSVVGYGIPEQTVHSLSYVYSDEQGIILLTDFILCGVTLETTLSHIKKADVKDNSNIIFTLDEWVKKTLIL